MGSHVDTPEWQSFERPHAALHGAPGHPRQMWRGGFFRAVR
jgi:hypothetical protein